MSYAVNSVDTLHDAFINFTKSLRVGAHQIFYFPDTKANLDAAKKDLIRLFVAKPSFQWIEIDGRAVIQESIALKDAAKKLIGPNYQQHVLTQDIYQLHNNPMYGIIINNFDPAKDSPEQNPITIDILESIFPNVKIVVIYLHSVLLDYGATDTNGVLTNYAELILNKVVKTFDEDDADSWSIITNQMPLFYSDGYTKNQAAATAATSKSQEANKTATDVKKAATDMTGITPDFKKLVAALPTKGTAADTAQKIQDLADDISNSLTPYGSLIKNSLMSTRDMNVCVIDGQNTMSALEAIEDISKDKPYVILIYNYDLASSIINREFNKMKAMAISQRQNASGSGYAVCQFMIASPKVTATDGVSYTSTYLCYQAK